MINLIKIYLKTLVNIVETCYNTSEVGIPRL